MDFKRLTADGIVITGSVLLLGVLVDPSAANLDVNIYEGGDASSGRLIMTIHAGQYDTKIINLPAPLYCQRGLYVDIGSNVNSVTVFYAKPA